MLFAAAAAAAAVFAAPAMAEETVFSRDGQTYAYTSKVKGDTTIIEGRALPQNTPFELTVRGRVASGRVDGRPVSFRIAKPLTPVKVASRGTEVAGN
ncbi:MAG TPA: hypothetical protein VL973_07040 [Sphingomonas sp.]|nr:hypothetical protein [Sphingomonas sp.]HTG38543.1 hypothetical protein [Sphingomonas sp.]